MGRTSGVPPSSRGGGGMPSYVVGGPACQPTALRFGVSLGFASVTRHPRPHSGILSPSVTGGDAVTVMWVFVPSIPLGSEQTPRHPM